MAHAIDGRRINRKLFPVLNNLDQYCPVILRRVPSKHRFAVSLRLLFTE
jgi:hypothetical protein